jgi:hypothetical protein
MKSYESFAEIERDLKQLSLEREIAFEELKMVKNDFEESIKPISILSSAVKFFSKYGVLMLVKKIFK